VRKEFYKSASSHLSLLKSIGVSQMEKELEKEVKAVEEKLSKLSPGTMVDIPRVRRAKGERNPT